MWGHSGGKCHPWFCHEDVEIYRRTGLGTGLFLQLNLVPQAMNESWVNGNPETERRTAHTAHEDGGQHDAHPE